MLERLHKRSYVNTKKVNILTLVLDDFMPVFEVMDVVFSKLRILDPTPEEIESTEKGIHVLEKLWEKLDLNKVSYSY